MWNLSTHAHRIQNLSRPNSCQGWSRKYCFLPIYFCPCCYHPSRISSCKVPPCINLLTRLLSSIQHHSLLDSKYNWDLHWHKMHLQYTCPSYELPARSSLSRTPPLPSQYSPGNPRTSLLSIYQRTVSDPAVCAQFPRIAMAKTYFHQSIVWHILLGWPHRKWPWQQSFLGAYLDSS